MTEVATSHRPTDERWPEALCYIAAILLSGGALWTLMTFKMVISPPSYADVCGDENAMCCLPCAVAAWFTIVPFVAFLFALIFFLPGYVTMRAIARRVARWRPIYWIPGWAVTGVLAAVLLAVGFAINDREFIVLNIDNGILWRRAVETVGFMIGLGFFGMLCGICYWLRDKRRASRNRPH